MSIMFVLLLAMASVPMVNAEIANHVVISEVYIVGYDNWIELYNPIGNDINLTLSDTGHPYRLEKWTDTGSRDIVVRFGDTEDATYPGGTTIPAYGFYLIVDNKTTNNTLRNKADTLVTRSFDLKDNYAIGFGNYTLSDNVTDENTIDFVGWGNPANSLYEGSPTPAIPDGKSIQRKVNATITEDGYGPACDSNCNCDDFFIQTNPNPQNCGSDPLPPVPELPSIFLLAIGLITLAGYVLLTKRK